MANFSDLTVSTKTIIAITNLQIDISKFFPQITTYDYIVVKKKRGRKKKIDMPDLNKDIPEGAIIYAQHKDDIKGTSLKKKKTTKKKKYFRNALTIIMVLKHQGNNKLINFKISKNGKFQITGCKSITDAKKIISYIWKLMNKTSNSFILSEPHFKVIYHTVMTNVDFNLGFIVNREALDRYINANTKYNSLLETSFGYTGINIKFLILYSLDLLEIPTFTYIDGNWVESSTFYKDIPSKKKKKYNTFLVFHSGNIIMSGMIEELMKPAFDAFQTIIKNCKNLIEEKLDL
jgi:TATA-box binding protein (TBP) (component of TFIID and TFIIIB)